MGGWESLPGSVLSRIYGKLPVEELVVGAPLACRSWFLASLDPALWRDPNLQDWSRIMGRLTAKAGSSGDMDNSFVDLADFLELILPRSLGMVESIRFPDMGIRECDLVLVSHWCPNLKFFYLRWASMIPKQAFPLAISKWTGLEGMEVDECSLRRETLQQIQSSCKNFVYLKVAGRLSFCTAYDIVNFLPKLKAIDLSYTEFMHDALLHILKGCKELESLDITGCGKLGIYPAVQKLAAHLKTYHYDSAPFPEKQQQQYCPDCFDDSDYYEYGTVSCSCLRGYY